MSTIVDVPVALEVDARNMPCPMPLLKAKQGLNKVSVGELVRVIVTDPASERDFKAYIRLSEHVLEAFEYQESQLVYLLLKGSPVND